MRLGEFYDIFGLKRAGGSDQFRGERGDNIGLFSPGDCIV